MSPMADGGALRFRTWMMALILCASVALVYCRSLESPFVLDDNGSIVENLIVVNGDLSLSTVEKILKSTEAPRLIPALSFVANHFASGLDKASFHAVNIAIHCANAILLLLVSLRLLRHAMPEGPWRLAAFFAALLWTVNPIALTSVVYIVQRSNSLAALFCLAAFLCYLEGRVRPKGGPSWPLLCLGAALWLCAMLCKQISAPLPAIALLCEMIVFGRRDRRFIGGSAILCAVAAVLAFLVAGLTLKWDFGWLFRYYSELDFTLSERLLSEPRAVLMYLLVFLLPLESYLRLDFNDFTVSRGLLTPPSTLFAIFGVVLLLALAVRLFKREPLLCFCILWYFGMLFVESSFICLELAYLHRGYLPTAFIALAFSYLVFKKLSVPKATLALLAMSLFYGFLTFSWSLDWRDEVTLWKAELAKSPGNLRVLTSLGTAYQNKGMNDKALVIYERGIKLEPGLWQCHYNRGLILMELGDFAGAERSIGEALRLFPENPEINKAMGALLAKTGRASEAGRLFEKGASLQTSKSGGSDYNLGLLAASKGDFQEALRLFDAETRRNPSDWKAWKGMGDAQASLGNAAGAASSYAKAVAINSSSPESSLGLGLAFFNMGRPKESAAAFRKVLELKPDDAIAERGLGASLALTGGLQEAELHLKRALALGPDSPETRNALGGVCAMAGRFKEAEAEFLAALRLNPSDASARDNLAKVRAKLKAN